MFLLVVAASVTVAAVAQSVVGFGFALLVVPILAATVGPETAVAIVAAVGLPVTTANALRWRAAFRPKTFAIVTVAAFIGMPLGVLLRTHADDRLLTLLVGAVVLVFTVALWRRFTMPAGPPTELGAGIVSGALSTSVGTGGPPLVVAFQATGMAPEPFRATLAAAFAVHGAVVLTVFWAEGLVDADVGAAALVGIPAALVGALLGDRVFARLDRERFRAAVLVMLAASGVVALASAVRG